MNQLDLVSVLLVLLSNAWILLELLFDSLIKDHVGSASHSSLILLHSPPPFFALAHLAAQSLVALLFVDPVLASLPGDAPWAARCLAILFDCGFGDVHPTWRPLLARQNHLCLLFGLAVITSSSPTPGSMLVCSSVGMWSDSTPGIGLLGVPRRLLIIAWSHLWSLGSRLMVRAFTSPPAVPMMASSLRCLMLSHNPSFILGSTLSIFNHSILTGMYKTLSPKLATGRLDDLPVMLRKAVWPSL